MKKLQRSKDCVIAMRLPNIGETCVLADFGKVKVLSIFHDSHGNHIMLEFLETVLGAKVLTFPFEITE